MRKADPGAFVAGLYFLGVAGIFFASGFSGGPILPLPILAPVLVIGLALVLLVRVMTRSRRREPRLPRGAEPPS